MKTLELHEVKDLTPETIPDDEVVAFDDRGEAMIGNLGYDGNIPVCRTYRETLYDVVWYAFIPAFTK